MEALEARVNSYSLLHMAANQSSFQAVTDSETKQFSKSLCDLVAIPHANHATAHLVGLCY